MPTREEVHRYSLACERVLPTTQKQSLAPEETHRVEYYRLKLLADIAPYLSKEDQLTS